MPQAAGLLLSSSLDGIICCVILIMIYIPFTRMKEDIIIVSRVQLNLSIYPITNLTHLLYMYLFRVVMLGDSLKSLGKLHTSRNSIIYFPWTRRISI